MTSLSLIETEAHQLVRRLPESRRLAQQAALVERTTKDNGVRSFMYW